MDKVLDIILEYSNKGMEANISKMAMEIFFAVLDANPEIKDKYVRAISSGYIKDARMSYSASNGVITFNIEALDNFYNTFDQTVETWKFSAFELFFIKNTEFARVLCHEIGHAKQFRKQKTGNDFEALLLRMLFYPDNEFLRLNPKMQELIRKKGMKKVIPRLWNETEKIRILTRQHGYGCPVERMAELDSYREISVVLDYLRINHPKVLEYYLKMMSFTITEGYDFNNEIVSPTERYIIDYKNLNISGMKDYFDDNFYELMNEANNAPVKKRLQLGLRVSEEEYRTYDALRRNNN